MEKFCNLGKRPQSDFHVGVIEVHFFVAVIGHLYVDLKLFFSLVGQLRNGA